MSDSDIYKLATKVNGEVNGYPYATDASTFGTADFWEPISTAGRGDCEDYVLEKRARLLKAGVDPSALRIGVVDHPTGGSHAVLVIRDGDQDWIADQTQPALMTLDQAKNLGYKGDRLQVPGQWDWERWEI